jgi:hypothetical protein
MAEAALLTGISIGLAVLLAELVLPVTRRITDSPIAINYTEPVFWLAIAGLFLLTTVLSGIYPALVLSSFRPVQILKGNLISNWNDALFRKGLVVVQFCLSLLLIIGAFVVQRQLSFIQNKNLGLDRENILFIEMDDLVGKNKGVIQEKLGSASGIASVTKTSHAPIDVQASTNGLRWPGKPGEHAHTDFSLLWTEPNFTETYKVDMVAGRFYRTGTPSDTNAIVLNETAARIIGKDNLLEQPVELWGEQRQVIGIVQDFHLRSLFEQIPPLVIINDPEMTWSMAIRTRPGETATAIESLQETFAEVMPGYTLEYQFLDERYEAMYAAEQTTRRLSGIFAVLAILISCLGLLGLTAYTAEQRTREIGIRKVLGASITDIFLLLNRDFSRLLAFAFLLAVPLAVYFLRHWLERFAYHVELNAWVFLFSAGLILVVATLTVSYHSLRAATANPADALKRE